jgi:hypothetical protein
LLVVLHSAVKAYARRQGRSREGFAPVSSVVVGGEDAGLAGGGTQMSEFVDASGGPTGGSAGARTDNDSL